MGQPQRLVGHDDRPHKRGAATFQGELVHFGPEGDYHAWPAVMANMRERAAEG